MIFVCDDVMMETALAVALPQAACGAASLKALRCGCTSPVVLGMPCTSGFNVCAFQTFQAIRGRRMRMMGGYSRIHTIFGNFNESQISSSAFLQPFLQ